MIVMRGPPATSDTVEASPSAAAPQTEVDRILKAVEAVSSRSSNPDQVHFRLCDQVSIQGNILRLDACFLPFFRSSVSICHPSCARVDHDGEHSPLETGPPHVVVSYGFSD